MTSRVWTLAAAVGGGLALMSAPRLESARVAATTGSARAVDAGAAPRAADVRTPAPATDVRATPSASDVRAIPVAMSRAGDGDALRGARPVLRTVLALYDSQQAARPRDTVIHSLAEMPLNHLGLVVRYHDIRQGLPPVPSLADVRGVLTWFAAEGLPDPVGYLRWIDRVVDAGKRVVIVGALGALRDDRGGLVPEIEINRTLQRLGWRYDGRWHTTTAGGRYSAIDPAMIGFERPLPVVVPPYATIRATVSDARVVVRTEVSGRAGTTSDLIIVSPRGAYVAPGYAYYVDRSGDHEFRQWYLNPFEFFRAALATDEVPKLDTATLSGRRIYYSHIDGDGWRNLTRIEPFHTQHVSAARVVLDAIIKPSPDLPVTVGAIAGDLDRAWAGTAESLALAKDLYALPHVEAAIHTYSHPLDWEYFDVEPNPRRAAQARASRSEHVTGPDVVHSGRDKPRSYDTRPFNLTTEFDEAAAFVNRLLPAGTRVGLVQWSGDTRPFRQALRHARLAGLDNINGGDTRFDREFPSAAWVSPLAERIGDELQVYASNSNENTYTDLWRDRFFGFAFLSKTVANTGAPRRIKPFNLYYHMYSGERFSSLNAVLANLAVARSLPLAPIEASRFSRIVQGFFSASLEAVGPQAWYVRNRGALQTVRFDAADALAVDFTRSRGVVGQRHELGSLFVALDESAAAPLIVLTSTGGVPRDQPSGVVSLVESRWRVFDVRRDADGIRYATQGYGPGEATWSWPFAAPADVRWRAASGRSGTVQADAVDGRLLVRLPQLTNQRVDVVITSRGGRRAAL